ncbi:D-alanyl-D-alanine carboxypeptidase DacC precursor [compost metagenome]
MATPKAWKGAQDTVKMGSATPIIVNVPAGTGGKLETQVVSQEPLIAPFTKGQKLGSLKVMAGGQQVAEVPLVALEDVGEAGIFGRAWDAIRLWIK